MKLKNFPKILLINLPENESRRSSVEQTFLDYGITDYKFVPGVYAKDIEINNLVIGKTFNAGNPNKESSLVQQAVVLAHIKTLKDWLAEDPEDEYVVIMEDDVWFYPVDKWNWTWQEFQSKLPKDFDIIQLCILKIEPKEYTSIKFEHRVRRSDYASTAAYLISKSYAKQLVERHVVGDKYQIEPPAGMNTVADELLYDSDNVYAIPLFLFDDEYRDNVHYPAKMHMVELWDNIGKASLNDIWGK